MPVVDSRWSSTDGSVGEVSLEVQHRVEQFLYYEAELLDDRRYRDWYDLLSQDIQYWMPTRSNRLSRELSEENSKPGAMALFDDDKQSLGWRVRQLESGVHWAEDPPSRTRHIVSNIRVRPGSESAEPDAYLVRSNFLCYRNRLDTEVDIWAGERLDTLRSLRHAPWFEVARRTILLDQNVVLSKNLSVFF
jgi:3-phenylpropionate/cinnamic acid dioxygenase small subunit